MKSVIKKIWHHSIGPTFNHFLLKHQVDGYNKRLPYIIKRIREKQKIKVVFFAINEGMWKSDELFKLLLKDNRFEPIIVSYLYPIDSSEYHQYVQKSMRTFFVGKGYQYYDSYDFETKKWLNMESINPDIVFYTQPYNTGYPQYDIKSLWDKCLFIYIPYCYQMEDIPLYHNLLLQNVCWKMFYPTEYHKQMGEKYAYNRGRNIVVTGNPMTDTLITNKRIEWRGWKQREPNLKRVIWAPHHSIKEESTLHNSNFLVLADEMIGLAKEYEGKVQFAFKPHPRLIKQLQDIPEWGNKRAKEYYRQWDTMPNTIFVEGEYTDLFKSSDALIHDCSSFMGEYLNTCNPLLFVARSNPTAIMNDFGKACYSQHYVGKTIDDIRHFIDEVVIAGIDPMRKQREKFFEEVLKPPFGKTVAENMYIEMVKMIN